MEDRIKFIPAFWKLFQLDSANCIHRNYASCQTRLEKIYFLLNYLTFVWFILNSLLYFGICFAEFFQPSLTIERMVLVVVIITNCLRYTLNYLIIFLNFSKINEIFRKLPQSYSNDDMEKYKIQQKIERSRWPSISGFMLTFFSLLLVIATSGLSTYVKRIITIEFQWIHCNKISEFLFNLWFVVAINVRAALAVIYDTLIYGLIIILTIEFKKISHNIDELKQKIDKLIKNKRKSDDNSQNSVPGIVKKSYQYRIQQQYDILSQIIEIIDQHIHLLEIRDMLETIFAPSMLINFVCGLIGICIEEFASIVAIEKFPNSIGLMISGITQSIMMYIGCSYCQKLKDVSLAVADAIYDCKWEEIEDEKVKKHLLLMLIRSQKSKTLTCWKFMEISFELFGSVSNSFYLFRGYSYIT